MTERKRELRRVIVIHADDETCGTCDERQGRKCAAFGALLKGLPDGDTSRLPECLQAESAAMPWIGTDDGDEPPHLEANAAEHIGRVGE
jgi:hypothetical protein